MRLHALRHVDFEGTGCINDWADANGVAVTETLLQDGDTFPNLEEFDVLLVMGGPMGVADTDKHPWLDEEKTFIESAIDDGKFVVGFCLGAQLIADVLGAEIYPAEQKEIGWMPVTVENGARESELFPALPSTLTVLHWHGDTFDLPEGTECLASSEVCPHQGFVLDDRVIGFQFHLEMTPASVTDLIENCRDELVETDFVQSDATIREGNTNCEPTNDLLVEILELIGEQLGDNDE